MIEVSAVSCSRKGTYDAEVQLRYGKGFDNPSYKQVVISTGHPDRKSATAAAEVVADMVRDSLVQTGISLLSVYKEAQE